MSSSVVRMKRYSQDSLSQLADTIESYNSDSDLVVRQLNNLDGKEVLLLVFEKYYFRTGSMAVLTVQGVSDGEKQSVTIVGTGGGEGFLNISWGANSNYAEGTADCLESIGFTVISNEDI